MFTIGFTCPSFHSLVIVVLTERFHCHQLAVLLTSILRWSTDYTMLYLLWSLSHYVNQWSLYTCFSLKCLYLKHLPAAVADTLHMWKPSLPATRINFVEILYREMVQVTLPFTVISTHTKCTEPILKKWANLQPIYLHFANNTFDQQVFIRKLTISIHLCSWCSASQFGLLLLIQINLILNLSPKGNNFLDYHDPSQQKVAVKKRNKNQTQ